MKTLLETAAEIGIRFRIKQLRPTNPARWGRTNAPRVVGHLVEVLAGPLSTSSSEPGRLHGPLRIAAVRWAYLQGRPCESEKALAAPAEITPEELEAWDSLTQAWYTACDRFVNRARAAAPLSPHPVFGRLPNEEWGRIVYLHTDYHLRQLGV